MKNILTFTIATFMGLQGFSHDNPFFKEWNTPFEVPPFDQIRIEHFMPAYQAGIAEEAAEVWAIIRNPEPPTFENTIVALDRTGPTLRRVMFVFSGLMSVNNSPEMQRLAREFSPMMSRHRDDISFNPLLFQRVKAVYEQKDRLNLNIEQRRLLENTHRRFIRSGADLPIDKQNQLRRINSELSAVQLQFNQNVLAETANFTLRVTDRRRLGGLSAAQLAEARARAERAGYPNEWHFGLDNPSIMPFLTSADDRELRTEILHAFLNRANNDNDHDNKENARKIVTLRSERAKIMGFDNYAQLATQDRMSNTPEIVMDFSRKVWEAGLATAKNELRDIENEMRRQRVSLPATPADWRYFQRIARERRFNLNEEEVRQYFEIGKVLEGIFYVCNRLWGITFQQLHDMPLPHPEATAWKCLDKDGTTVLGIIYLDMHPRPGTKNGGAWCGVFRQVSYDANGNRVPPIITVGANFTRPSGNTPALLTLDEVETYFHEFGHVLGHLFRETRYFGTARVQRDFGEFDAQVMEHWAFHPDVLRVYARHHRTGRVIPNSLLQRIEQSGQYGMGFRTSEFMASALVDMEVHMLSEIPADFNVVEFEYKIREKYNMLPQIPLRHRTPVFRHTFTGGYNSGYYMYMWAEQLDADAFEAFLEAGNIFDQELARKLRFEIFARGDIEDAAILYRNFRGRDPDVNALLRNRGLIQ